ncbi:MAG: DUF4145 domain-containing protein [Gallionella sp.]|nr:DUF4145 domain-containing protein [Gallionella sp.]
MAVDVELWHKSFGALDPKALPSWPCPSCGKASVILDSKTLVYRPNKTQYNPEAFKKEDFEESMLLGILKAFATAYEQMQWVQHKFVGFLKCKDCGESISFAGRVEIPRETANRPTSLNIRLYPEYFSPPLPFFLLDSQYPVSIRERFNRSFGFAFNDAASAANAIRQGVESILDELGVPRVEQGKSRLSLYDRIRKFSEINKECAELLDAIRFLGNEGSHAGKVNRADVVAAFEVVDHVLDEVFVRSKVRKKVMKSSKDIAKTYRPQS